MANVINSFSHQYSADALSLSLIIPVYNEGADLARHIRAIMNELVQLQQRYRIELILVDDGSKDNTWTEIVNLQKFYPGISGIRFTRNFGKEAAIMAGLEATNGDAVVIMDSDLQHPPHFVPKMVELWEQGHKIVEMLKTENQNQSGFYRFASMSFYSILYTVSKINLKDNCDFKLLDKLVVKHLLSLPEKQRFFRGLVQWLGFPAARLQFTVPERSGGVTKWSITRLARYAIDNITSFTAWPLYFASWIGGLVTMIGLAFVLISLYQKISGSAETGFTTVISLTVLFGGLNLLVLGFIGFYLARIFEEIKGRPRFVIQDKVYQHADVRLNDVEMLISTETSFDVKK